DSERAQLASPGEGRRAVRVDFIPSPVRAAAGLTITRVREGLATVGEIVKVVPLSRPVGQDAPGGLLFALLVVTAATDDELAEAAGGGVQSPRPIGARAMPLEEEVVDDGVGARGVVRVEVARLDDALERLSALVVTRFRLGRAVAEL